MNPEPITPLHSFEQVDQLQDLSHTHIAFQIGAHGGIWIKQFGKKANNGGTIVSIDADSHWARQCDQSRLDARWFGVTADGVTDDAPALQAAINALPESGGKLLLPSGRMRCCSSLQINRSFITLEGSNCGLLSKHFESSRSIGKGSMLFFEGTDGIVIQTPASEVGAQAHPPRLGGITLRELGIAGTGKGDSQTGVLVKRGENRPWGSTDGLLLDRVYCIDLDWAVELNQADMTVITNSWLSECGNGLILKGCVYNCITNTCIADNDGHGLVVQGGDGIEVDGSIFVRNKCGLEIKGANRTSVIGGTFETNHFGGPRKDGALIRLNRAPDTTISGTTFTSSGSAITAAIEFSGEEPTTNACTCSGELKALAKELGQE